MTKLNKIEVAREVEQILLDNNKIFEDKSCGEIIDFLNYALDNLLLSSNNSINIILLVINDLVDENKDQDINFELKQLSRLLLKATINLK